MPPRFHRIVELVLMPSLMLAAVGSVLAALYRLHQAGLF